MLNYRCSGGTAGRAVADRTRAGDGGEEGACDCSERPAAARTDGGQQLHHLLHLELLINACTL